MKRNPELKYKVAVLFEGFLGDSLVFVPALRLISEHYEQQNVLVVSLSESGDLAIGNVLGKTFPNITFIYIPGNDSNNLFSRVLNWVFAAYYLKKQGITTVLYGLRPENKNSIKRAKFHLLIFRLFGNFSLLGFRDNNIPIDSPSRAASGENLTARLLFNRVTTVLNIESQFKNTEFKIVLSVEDINHSKTWVSRNLNTSKDNFYTACITAKSENKCWEIENYLKVFKCLFEKYELEPILVGSPDDRDIHDKVLSEAGIGSSSTGLTLNQNAGILNQSKFYLGNDTGVMHLAAAVGIPCIAVFSARSIHGTWRPLGEGHKIHENRVPCAGCELSICNLPEQICLTEIKWKDVAKSCESIINNGKPIFGHSSKIS